jgi:hypothetical protein
MTGTRAEHWRALGIALAATVTAGCSSVSATQGSQPVVIASGQLPPSEVPLAAESASEGASSADTTIPLAKQNPTTALFSAIGVFQSCLQGLGVTFIGAPNPQDPNSPANNPSYIKNLVTCATKSDILQALKTEQTAQDNLTPAQVKTENKDYILWRKCMIARGWQIPVPTPNEKGLLFSFGAGGSGGAGGSSGFQPPPGQSVLSSPDIEDCASLAEHGRS